LVSDLEVEVGTEPDQHQDRDLSADHRRERGLDPVRILAALLATLLALAYLNPTNVLAALVDISAAQDLVQPSAEPASDILVGPASMPNGIHAGGVSMYAVVENASSSVRTVRFEGTYLFGENPTAQNSVIAYDLLPGERRPVVLISPDGGVPWSDGASMAVDQIVTDAPTTAKAEVAKHITFGASTVGFVPAALSTALQQEVTNTDTKPHTFSVIAGFLNGDTMVGYVSGTVTDMQPGETRTVLLRGNASEVGWDSILTSVKSVSN
jgi:hypothetical protein